MGSDVALEGSFDLDAHRASASTRLTASCR